jgi:hypothetical protein
MKHVLNVANSYLAYSKYLGNIGPGAVDEVRMEEHCVSRVHLQVYPNALRRHSLLHNTVVHFGIYLK